MNDVIEDMFSMISDICTGMENISDNILSPKINIVVPSKIYNQNKSYTWGKRYHHKCMDEKNRNFEWKRISVIIRTGTAEVKFFEEDYIINTNKLAVSNKYSDTEDLHESDTSNKVAYLK